MMTIQQVKNHSSPRYSLICFLLCISIMSLVTAECPDRCTCSRYTTTCLFAKLNSLPTKLPTTTQFLRVEGDHITELNNSVITSVGLQNLTRLRLYKVNLHYIIPGSFEGMRKLEQLQLMNNDIGFLGRGSFRYLDRLYLLDLSGNYIGTFHDGVFSELRNIRYLNIDIETIPIYHAVPFRETGQVNNCTTRKASIFRALLYPLSKLILEYVCRFTYFRLDIMHKDNIRKLFELGEPAGYVYHIEFIFRNTDRKTTGLLYLDMQCLLFPKLKRGWFQNLMNLTYLNLASNQISVIESGSFEGLTSLRTLILRYNDLVSINSTTFQGLVSLKTLDISFCKIKTIESGAFGRFPKLQIMQLTLTNASVFEGTIFASYPEVKQFQILDKRLDSSFQNLGNTTRLHYYNYTQIHVHVFRSVMNIRKNKWYFLLGDDMILDQTGFQQNIDWSRIIFNESSANLEPAEVGTLWKCVYFYIDVTSVESSNDIRELLLNNAHIKEIELTLVNINSNETLGKFSDSQVTTLNLFFRDLAMSYKMGRVNGFPNLKYLLVHGLNEYSTSANEACDKLSFVMEFINIYKFRLLILESSLLELSSFSHQNTFPIRPIINILQNPRCKLYLFKIDITKNKPSNCIDKQMFLGLNKLVHLILQNNGITCIKPGTFQDLHSIEYIDISLNYIGTIRPGVFGAECVDNFVMSCRNVTLPEYCNSTNALKSLRYLDLSHNNLSYIHPYAFISCTNLRTLILEHNEFLTLNSQFLFTPGLRILNMFVCGTTQIPDNTFLCTPLLSKIDLMGNDNITKLSLDSLLPLRNLVYFSMASINVICDCDFYNTWIWLRKHRVDYTLYCGYTLVDEVLSVMNCSTSTQLSTNKNVTKFTRHDFAFFKLYIEPIVLIIIFMLGLISNMFLLFVALRHSDMRTKHNIFIIHLAILDILTLTLHLPLSYWDVLNVRWEFDDTTCKIFIFSKDVLVAVTVFSIICVGVERFLVAKTFKNLKNTCISRIVPTTWLLFMTWLSAVVLSLPAYYSATVEIRCLYCPPNNQDYIRNVWTFQMIMYCLLPAAALSFLNIKASMFLRESVKRIPGELKNNTRAQNRITVANIVLVLILIFIISYLPNYTLRVLVAWSVVEVENVFLGAFVTYCLFFCITLFNPISVFIMSSKFKSRALSYFSFREK